MMRSLTFEEEGGSLLPEEQNEENSSKAGSIFAPDNKPSH